MAGTVSYTRGELYERDKHFHGESVIVSWTSNASGAADGTVRGLYGWLIRAKTKPVVTPSDNYDIKLKDSDSGDVLCGVLADRDQTNVEYYPNASTNSGVSVICYLNGDYTFDITNAGDTKSGTCEFWIKTK